MKPEIDTKPKSKKEKKEEDDPRSMPTKINLAKNKMRDPWVLIWDISMIKVLLMLYMQVHNQLDETPKVDQKLEKMLQLKSQVDFIKLVGLRSKWVIKQLYQEETCVTL